MTTRRFSSKDCKGKEQDDEGLHDDYKMKEEDAVMLLIKSSVVALKMSGYRWVEELEDCGR